MPMKIFAIILFMILTLNARENPFFPSSKDATIPFTSNQTQDSSPLKQISLTFPSTARTIESVTIKYKNLDGSIATKKETLGNSIDWHLPIFVSQNYAETKPKVKVAVKIIKKFNNIVSLKFITLFEREKELKLITKDKMIRNFILTKPHRVVCDFKRNIDFRSYEKDILGKSIVKKVRVGNHDGYYRLVIELDGYYKYTTQNAKNGYLFTFL